MWRTFLMVSLLFVIYDNSVRASYCRNLKENYTNAKLKRYVSIQGNLKNVSIYWNSVYSRAASALLAVLLRHVIGYQDVYLHHKSHEALQKNEVMLAVTDSSQAPDFLPKLKEKSEINCQRQVAFSLQQFYVHIPHKFRNLKQCVNVTSWNFYDNVTVLQDCGFQLTSERNIPTEIENFVSEEVPSGSYVNIANKRLKIYSSKPTKPIEALVSPTVTIETVNECIDILKMVTIGTNSFLFYDDIWQESPTVSKVEQPSCNRLAQTSSDEMNTLIHIRVANVSQLLEYAPSIYQIGNLVFSHDYLKIILENENITKNIEEAACEWAMEHLKKINEWRDQSIVSNENYYRILNFFNDKDENNDLHIELPRLFSYEFNSDPKSLNIEVISYRINSSDIKQIRDIIKEYMFDNYTCLFHTRQQLIGAVVGNMKNISEVIQTVDDINLPIVLYVSYDIDVKSKSTLWLASSNSVHLALALQHFVLDMNWTRVAVLSDMTEIAHNFFNNLKRLDGFSERLFFRDHSVQSKISESNKLLKELKSENARIIFVNTNYNQALEILAAAERFEMTSDYVWIVRDWRSNNKIYNITPITFSFLNENSKYVEDNDGWRDLRKIIKDTFWPNVEWPVQAPALVDAFLTLIRGFEAVFRHYPQARHDVHSELAIREFERSILEEKMLGVTQNLIYDSETHSLKESVVIIEEWHGLQRELLARYRVYMTARIVNIEKAEPGYRKYAEVYDGTVQCLVHYGDKYQNTCYDIYVFPTIATVIALFIIGFTFKIVSRSRYQKVNIMPSTDL